ncbi:MAG: glycosyltransferase family 4 protein [Vicinamibacterales bacterium]
MSAPSLAIFLSHPIQHFVPWLQALNERLEGRLVVHYASRHGLEARHDPEFGSTFAWDMDMLSGYRHQFWEQPGTRQGPDQGFWGIRYPGLAAELRRHRPTAVLVWGWLFAGYWQAAATAKWLGIPYFIRGESNLLGGQHGAKWLAKQQTIGRLCRGAAGCISIGTRNSELYQAYGVPRERIWTAPYFVDNDWFAAARERLAPERAALRAKYGLPADATTFLFMGKFVQKKHPDALLRAWRALPESSRNRSALLMVGSGAMGEELRRLAGNDPRIAFAGLLNRNELPEAYTASDVLVLPSDAGETWGLVVNEAMACGLPALVSDQVGSGPDLVLPGRTGDIFPLGDEVRLGAALQQLIDNPVAVDRLGRAAHEHLLATASVARAVDTTHEALVSLSTR